MIEPMETIVLGICQTCGGPVQFIEGGIMRHVDVSQHRAERAEALLKQMTENCPVCDGDGYSLLLPGGPCTYCGEARKALEDTK